MTYHLDLVFVGVDFDDDTTFVALSDLTELAWRGVGPIACVSTDVSGLSALEAVSFVVQKIVERVPSARLLRIDNAAPTSEGTPS